MSDTTWLLRLDAEGSGPRLAVKDCIDVAGTPTTAGCPAIADHAGAAVADAPVVEHARRQGARIVGKTNLVELCRHADGVNSWTGTPRNPIDARRIPGGSSSGSAVAVAVGEADVAYGTDTGGSVRVPAACCGIAGLKTTAGRIPTHGVFEFSRTQDTVGPLARDVAGLALGMSLMEPGFKASDDGVRLTAARLRVPGVEPGIDAAVDAALEAAGVRTVDVQMPEWDAWVAASDVIITAEGYWAHRHLLARADRMEPRHAAGIAEGAGISTAEVIRSQRIRLAAADQLLALFAEHGIVAVPTIPTIPPLLGEKIRTTRLTTPFNLTGLPAVALPVPRVDGGFPASLQLVGPWYGEEQLLTLAAIVESALVT